MHVQFGARTECSYIKVQDSFKKHIEALFILIPRPPPPPVRSAISLFIVKQPELHANYVAAVPEWNFRNLYFWIDKVEAAKEGEENDRSETFVLPSTQIASSLSEGWAGFRVSIFYLDEIRRKLKSRKTRVACRVESCVLERNVATSAVRQLAYLIGRRPTVAKCARDAFSLSLSSRIIAIISATPKDQAN